MRLSSWCDLLKYIIVFVVAATAKHKTRFWNWWLNIIANEWLDYQCIGFMFFNVAILGMSDCMRMNSIRVSLQNSTSGKPFPFNIQYHITDGFYFGCAITWISFLLVMLLCKNILKKSIFNMQWIRNGFLWTDRIFCAVSKLSSSMLEILGNTSKQQH